MDNLEQTANMRMNETKYQSSLSITWKTNITMKVYFCTQNVRSIDLWGQEKTCALHDLIYVIGYSTSYSVFQSHTASTIHDWIGSLNYELRHV